MGGRGGAVPRQRPLLDCAVPAGLCLHCTRPTPVRQNTHQTATAYLCPGTLGTPRAPATRRQTAPGRAASPARPAAHTSIGRSERKEGVGSRGRNAASHMDTLRWCWQGGCWSSSSRSGAPAHLWGVCSYELHDSVPPLRPGRRAALAAATAAGTLGSVKRPAAGVGSCCCEQHAAQNGMGFMVSPPKEQSEHSACASLPSSSKLSVAWHQAAALQSTPCVQFYPPATSAAAAAAAAAPRPFPRLAAAAPCACCCCCCCARSSSSSSRKAESVSPSSKSHMASERAVSASSPVCSRCRQG